MSYSPDYRMFIYAVFCISIVLSGCASIDHQLASDPAVVQSYITADMLADLEKQGRYQEMLLILNQEEQAAKTENNQIKRAYVLNEKAYVYYDLLGDYHSAKQVNSEAQSVLAASGKYDRTTYTNLPKAVKDGRKIRQTVHYDYFRQFRNISLAELKKTVTQRQQILSQSLGKSELFREEAIDQNRAKQVAKKLKKDSTLKMPPKQRTANQFRLAYAMLFIPAEQEEGLDLLQTTLHGVDPLWKTSPQLMDNIYPYLSPMQFVKVCMRAGKVSEQLKKI